MKKYHFVLLLLCTGATMLAPHMSFAQKNKDSLRQAEITIMVNNQDYTFTAQTVTPLSGRLRQLTSAYDLKVKKDIIVAQLPYFGRAFSAPINSTDGGIQFTAKDFVYTASNKKKGGWNVNIRFKDAKDVTQMQLSIFSNGTASLQVISNNRQSISFNGYVAATSAQ